MSGRDPIHLKLRELQSAGAVVRSTLQDGILRRISSLETASYLRSSEDWSQLLSQFSALGEHVDSLWKHVDTSFNFYIPVPCKPTHSHTDSNSSFTVIYISIKCIFVG